MGTYLGKTPIGVVLGSVSSSGVADIDSELWFVMSGCYVLETDILSVLDGDYIVDDDDDDDDEEDD